MKPTLLILAAGMGSRYGGLKQIDGVGPSGETIIEYSIYDAIRAGFGKVVFVIRKDIEMAFRERFGQLFESNIEVAYVFQETDSPLEGITSFPPREKPWGTGHAILMARDAIQEPFAVINADDYYGASSFETMADFLQQRCSPERYSMVGYQLLNTLSEAGHVNRGICSVNEANILTNVVERHRIQRENGQITYEENEQRFELSPEAIVSMNFWGFHPNIFQHLHQQFLRFVADNQDNPKAEFYIPAAVTQLIHSGAVTLEVLSSAELWYGVTYREDKEMVGNAFAAFSESGRYPNPLWQ
ncbi:MAG TPA: sugar phosphate nucleotidyltransferase [Saprospiraceae bacterium]|nr:sugar phosphate nucleotidyltransferase [Saprospiraceae bacterium]HMQ81645.1 sugar phosphate nucleotidyltransferase [Saprospiraceae bacterium]